MEELKFPCRFDCKGECKHKGKCCMEEKDPRDNPLYEYPLNVVFFDDLRVHSGFQYKDKPIEMLRIEEGYAQPSFLKKKVRGRILANEEKEALFKFLYSYPHFDEFFFVCTEKYSQYKSLLNFHKLVLSTKLFEVEDIQSGLFAPLRNYCNGCGYCPVCKKMVNFVRKGRKGSCGKCGNTVNLKRKVFNRKHTSCPSCGSKSFEFNRLWTVKYFVLRKGAFNL